MWKDDASRLSSTSIRVGNPATSFNAVLDLAGQWTWFDCVRTPATTRQPTSPSLVGQASAIGLAGWVAWDATGANRCRDARTTPARFFPTARLRIPPRLRDWERTSSLYARPMAWSAPDVSSRGFLCMTRATTSFPLAISAGLGFPHKFALCLPSSSLAEGHGDVCVGGGPYYRPHGIRDWSKSLLVTGLLVNHPYTSGSVHSEGDPSVEYFVDVRSIKVGYTPVSFKASSLDIDKKGIGGTKISTLKPYTIPDPSIYKPLIQEFVKAASRKKIRDVAAVKPFGACFRAKTIGHTKAGPDMPTIVLVLQSDVHWEIHGANSIVLSRIHRWRIQAGDFHRHRGASARGQSRGAWRGILDFRVQQFAPAAQ